MVKGTLTEGTWNYEKHKWGMDEDEYRSKMKRKAMKGHELESS